MDLIDHLNENIETFISASIARVADSGNMGYSYYLADGDIRAATGRVRLHEDAIISHFSKAKISCQYDATGKQYLIHVDLNVARLNARQSNWLTQEIARFKAEHL
jgi:hypothetical protein